MSTSSNDAPGELASPTASTTGRSGRPPNKAYIKLMKPDEDWRTMPDAAERRKIQNRLAQRAYRRNLRDRTLEVEKLKKQVMQLQEAEQRSPNPNKTKSCSSASSDISPGSEHSIESGPNSQDQTLNWVVEGFPIGLSEAPEPPTDMNFMDFEINSEFQDNGFSNRMSPALNSLESDDSKLDPSHSPFITSSPGRPPLHHHLRKESMPPGDAWSQTLHSPDMGVLPSMIHVDPSMDPGMPLPTSYSTSTSTDDDALGIGADAYVMGPNGMNVPYQMLRTRSATMPDGTFSKSPSPPNGPFFAQDGKSDMASWSFPDVNASLLHFAVAGGNLDTLRLLLKDQRAAINVRDREGFTPVQRAVMSGRTEMVALFLEHSALDLHHHVEDYA